MKDNIINIFLGYDPDNIIEYHVTSQSIIDNTNSLINIFPLRPLDSSGKKFLREEVEYSKVRFQVPFLSDYEGWSLYIDCDFVFYEDIEELWNLRDEKYSVMVVKNIHDQNEYEYSEMHWSSLMLFNNKKCTKLTLDYIYENNNKNLDQFCWLDNSDQIGELPAGWNTLCKKGIESSVNDKAYHFCYGAPWETPVSEQGLIDEKWNFHAKKILKHISSNSSVQGLSKVPFEEGSYGDTLLIGNEEFIIDMPFYRGLSGLHLLNKPVKGFF